MKNIEPEDFIEDGKLEYGVEHDDIDDSSVGEEDSLGMDSVVTTTQADLVENLGSQDDDMTSQGNEDLSEIDQALSNLDSEVEHTINSTELELDIETNIEEADLLSQSFMNDDYSETESLDDLISGENNEIEYDSLDDVISEAETSDSADDYDFDSADNIDDDLDFDYDSDGSDIDVDGDVSGADVDGGDIF